MHKRRLTRRAIAEDVGLPFAERAQLANWLAEDAPMSPKTEPFDRKKCDRPVALRADTFTHHQGDHRGVAWEQRDGRGASACLWLLCVGMHDEGYAKGCALARNGRLYPEDPADLEDWREDADEHEFARAFCDAATAIAAAGSGIREIAAGGYWAHLDLAYGPPDCGWELHVRRTKGQGHAVARWLNTSVVTDLVNTLFADIDADEPTVSFNVLEYAVYHGSPENEHQWLARVADNAVGFDRAAFAARRAAGRTKRARKRVDAG